jgi:hypothetical protein
VIQNWIRWRRYVVSECPLVIYEKLEFMSSPYWSLGWSGHDSCCRLNNFLSAVRLTKVWYCRISSCRIFSCKNILFSGTAWEHENVFFEFSTVQYCCSCVKISVYVQEEWLGLVLDQIRFDGYTVELLEQGFKPKG